MRNAVDLTKIDKFVVGISGGKDSTALLLWLLKEYRLDPSKLICTFCDTQWEALETYEHVELISRELHPVITLQAHEGFVDLVHRKGRFPSTKARFCTEELKLKPAKIYMESLSGSIISVNGMRREESPDRVKKNEFGGAFETYHGFPEWRPLLDWTLEDVFLIHKRYKFPLNPLYAMGFERVGCMPCIMSRKRELRLMAKLFPERVTNIRDVENGFPNGKFHSFARRKAVPERYRSKLVDTKKGEMLVPTIDDVVEWSRTTDHKQTSNYDFHFEDYEESLSERACMSGICE